MPTSTESEVSRPREYFVTTHWSVVVSAGRSDTPRARQALEQLCQTYWYPLYAYTRRRGYSPHDAEDVTQGFFARLLRHNSVVAVDPAKGKFRSFLLASMNHFLSDEWDKARAQKRDVGKTVALDTAAAETSYLQLPADDLTPEKVFEQRWALTVLEQVYKGLREDYAREDKAHLFEALRFALAGERSALPYAELAAQLKTSEGAVKVAVHRLRERYRKRLREQIAETVASPQEVEEELRYLLRALAS